MSIDVHKFWESKLGSFEAELLEGRTWPENLSGYVFIVAPYHRRGDSHLFAGEGLIIKWNLKAGAGKIKVYSEKLQTWDSHWHSLLPPLMKNYFPAVISVLGVSELANTAVVNMDGRLILTADAGRYWEVDPETLKTLTPVGYYDEHIVSLPLLVFPVLENTAHPFYDSQKQQIITCELKLNIILSCLQGTLLNDLVSDLYITCWDSKRKIRHWKVDGANLDGSPHMTIVTEADILIPDMPFQVGLGTLLGLKVKPDKGYSNTNIYCVRRRDLESNPRYVTARMVTVPGHSYHFLCNYHSDGGKIRGVSIQQATINLTETIEPDDVKHFSGDRYCEDYVGIPWMFAFDPGVLRKVELQLEGADAQLLNEEAFIHPGWFSTMLYTADPRELDSEKGYSAIYQVYAGYPRDLISRRQYLNCRDDQTRVLKDMELPSQDLPSVLARIPLDQNWKDLTEKLKAEQAANTGLPITHLGESLLDFFVFPPDAMLDSVQFIPQDEGYIFTTVLDKDKEQDKWFLEAWLFEAKDLKKGPVKLRLPEEANFGFTLHSEYFKQVTAHPDPPARVNQWASCIRSFFLVLPNFVYLSVKEIIRSKQSVPCKKQ